MTNYKRRANRIINSQRVYHKTGLIILEMHSVMSFGKHKGKTVAVVMEEVEGKKRGFMYLDWAREEIGLRLSLSVRRTISEKKKKYFASFMTPEKRKEAFDKRDKLNAEKQLAKKTGKKGGATPKRVFLFGKNKGFIKEYESQKKCAEDLGMYAKQILTYLRNKQLYDDKYYFGRSPNTFLMF